MSDETTAGAPYTMELWEAFGTTLPSETKEVKFGKRQFTAICAYSQFRKATKQWGPCGTGWGWDKPEFEERGPEIECHIAFWYLSPDGERAYIYHEGGNKLGDSDSKKKALTDALTKALSMLGMSADVFTGRFDDNKYVNDMRKAEAKSNRDARQQPEKPKPAPAPDTGSDGFFSEDRGHAPQEPAPPAETRPPVDIPEVGAWHNSTPQDFGVAARMMAKPMLLATMAALCESMGLPADAGKVDMKAAHPDYTTLGKINKQHLLGKTKLVHHNAWAAEEMRKHGATTEEIAEILAGINAVGEGSQPQLREALQAVKERAAG